MTLTVRFLDAEREPQCPPDPAFPDGIDVDLAPATAESCRTAIPYPAPRCGAMVVECSVCGLTMALTVAGRADDPKSVRVMCRPLARLREGRR